MAQVREIPVKSDRKPWVAPQVTDLPRLTELTLATGGAIPCGGGTGGGGTGLCP